MRRRRTWAPLAPSASDAEGHRQLDGRTAKADELAQISRPHMAAGGELDRRHIGADRAQVVGGRGIDQGAGAGRVGRDGGIVEMGGPAPVGAAIDHGAVADAVGGHHDRSGDFDFLFERRCHRSLTCKGGIGRSPAKIPPWGTSFYIWCNLAPQIAEYSTKPDVYGSRSLLEGEAKREEIGRVEPPQSLGAAPRLPSAPSPHRLLASRPGDGDQLPRVGP